jgi:hypothetical protein
LVLERRQRILQSSGIWPEILGDSALGAGNQDFDQGFQRKDEDRNDKHEIGVLHPQITLQRFNDSYPATTFKSRRSVVKICGLLCREGL